MEELADFRAVRIQTGCRALPLVQQGVTLVVR